MQKGVVGAAQLSNMSRVHKIAVLDHLVNSCEDLKSREELNCIKQISNFNKQLDNDYLKADEKKKGFHVLNVTKKLNLNALEDAKHQMAQKIKIA